MPVELTWSDEQQTIIIQRFYGKWTWNEFYEYNSKHIPKMMRQVDHVVHIVSDYTDGKSLPGGGAITHARNVVNNYPDNWGILVIVSDNMFIRSLVDIFCKIFQASIGKKVHSAKSREEAYDIINSRQDVASSG